MELDERKLKILQAIIRTYLDTGEPVGSRTISKYTDLNTNVEFKVDYPLIGSWVTTTKRNPDISLDYTNDDPICGNQEAVSGLHFVLQTWRFLRDVF